MKTKTRKLLLFGLVLVVLLPVGGYLGHRSYVYVRQVRLVKQAREYLAKPDPRKALLCLQRALRYNPRDIEALRMMADLAEAGRSPNALILRSRVVELNPHSLDDRLALAKVAMMMRDYMSATNALAGVDAADKQTVAYQNIAGAVAAAVNQPAEAEAHFQEAVRLDPQNPFPQLNLAVVRLHATNASVSADARATLERLSVNPTNSALRQQALRELAVDAMRHKQAESALALTGELLQQTNVVFSDRLLRLTVLQQTTNAGFKPALADAQQEAASDPGTIFALATWQMANTPPTDTLTWLLSLPMKTQTNLTVATLVAGAYTMAQDWPGLHSFLEPQNWGEVEFMRHAFQTRALRGQDLNSAAKAEWELALKSAAGQKARLTMLLSLAAQWNWQSEGEELLWTIVKQFPDEKWAFQTLTRILFINGRTRPLLMLYSDKAKRAPSDLGIKNNLAMTALLLDAEELKPNELAREVYLKSPTNAAYASTYAFSLYLQKKSADALKVIEQLKPQELENPSIAGYYGLILKATGDDAKARTYLNLASKAQLLPEERKLFEEAKVGA